MWLLILTLTLGGTACQQQDPVEAKKIARAEYEAEQAAYASLESFAKATPENEAAWGLTSFSIYGQPAIANPAGTVEHISQPDGYRVVIPLWIQGKNAQGELIRLTRKVSFDVKKTGEDSWTASSPQFLSEEPLSFRRLFWTWTLLGLAAVAVFVGMSSWICWIATRPLEQPTPSSSSAASSSGPADPAVALATGCGTCLTTLVNVVLPLCCLIEGLADPKSRLWCVCIGLAVLCWFLHAGTSNKLIAILGVLILGFPIMRAVKGLYDSALLATVLFLATFFATVFVWAAVNNYRAVRRSLPTQIGEPDFAEFLALLRKQQGKL